MDVRQVSYFLAVAEHGGFSRAASALDVAQPTLSQSVRALERELGAELFHRVSHGLVLSYAGRAFVGPARQMLRGITAAREAVGSREPSSAVLDLVTVPVLAAYPGASLVGSFRRLKPDIVVRIDEPETDDGLHILVRNGHSELGLAHLPVPHLGLHVVELGVQELWLAFPPGTDVGPADAVPLARLHGADVLGVPRGSWQRDHVEQALREQGVRTRLVVEVAHREALVPLVLGGAGTAFVVRETAHAAASLGAVVRPVDPPLRQAYGLVHRPGPLSPAAGAFLAHARAACGAG
ncbi:DNA-binding transcriptional LysR family regulator [Micromonospora kangleipakensis]|uniref:DNA-binding transcriptional LysR family regulator n=1 Tax=Micromonospora kangleipakensis TaxID=1077942 RepID=A0A4Q8BBY7_9ACTN|nr:LysR family transcriptional regulator [Micromonospora kangleipakensis]RZU75344.1 DNA-binding transcriptional LysR family regulator [Micromonospora kangleipakensis]